MRATSTTLLLAPVSILCHRLHVQMRPLQGQHQEVEIVDLAMCIRCCHIRQLLLLLLPAQCCVHTAHSQLGAPQAPQPRRRLASALTRPVNTLLVMVAVGVWKGLRRTWGSSRGSSRRDSRAPTAVRYGLCLPGGTTGGKAPGRRGSRPSRAVVAMLEENRLLPKCLRLPQRSALTPGQTLAACLGGSCHPSLPLPFAAPHPQVRLVHLREEGADGVIRLAIMQQQQACVAGRDKGSHKQVVEAVHRLTQQQ